MIKPRGGMEPMWVHCARSSGSVAKLCIDMCHRQASCATLTATSCRQPSDSQPSSGPSSLDDNRVAPAVGKWPVGHVSDTFSPSDSSKASVLVDTEAGGVLGKDRGLYRRDAALVGETDELRQELSAETFACSIVVHVERVLADGVTRPARRDRPTAHGP